jgi:hypothetical protein
VIFAKFMKMSVGVAKGLGIVENEEFLIINIQTGVGAKSRGRGDGQWLRLVFWHGHEVSGWEGEGFVVGAKRGEGVGDYGGGCGKVLDGIKCS